MLGSPVGRDELGPEVSCSTFAGTALPLVVQPADERHGGLDALLSWAGRRADQLHRAIVEQGAVLLRGFAVDDTAQFERVADLFPPYDMGYEAGATARARIAGRVYEATRVPPEVWIMLHQEMAYLPKYPSMLAFYCKTAPDEGGETTIGDMRAFTASLPARLMDEIAGKGVRYRRNFRSPDTHDGRADPVFNHRTWVEGFYTDDRGKVEDDCRARGLEFEWLADGSITTWNTLPGVARHGSAGDLVYFSQLHTQTPHWRWMGEASWTRYCLVYTEGVARPYDACYGDGTPLAEDDILTIYDALDTVSVSFPWQHGDVMFVDNLHTGHGRNPYVGTRDVQVALVA
jgi:alpha-ketoglutarate-dependent taurine dioxygenase